MMRRILIAAAVVAALVSPLRAQLVGQPTGQGATAPANPQIPQLPPAPPPDVASSGATPGATQYRSPTPSQLNAIGSNPNQSGGPARPEGPLR
jgi:hypothetical protein